MRTSSRSSPTRAAAIRSTKTPNCAASHATVTTACPATTARAQLLPEPHERQGGRHAGGHMVAHVPAGQDAARCVRMPPRHWIHHVPYRLPGHRIHSHRVRTAAHGRRGQPPFGQEQHRRTGDGGRDRLRGMVPVERGGRREQFPAQPVYRRSRNRTDRHQHRRLPQDRVQGAPQPLRVLLGERADGRIRHELRRVPRPVQWLGQPAGDRRRPHARLGGARLVPDRGRARAPQPAAGRGAHARVHARVRRSAG